MDNRLFLYRFSWRFDSLVIVIIFRGVIEIFVTVAQRVEIETIEHETDELASSSLQNLNRSLDVSDWSKLIPDYKQDPVYMTLNDRRIRQAKDWGSVDNNAVVALPQLRHQICKDLMI